MTAISGSGYVCEHSLGVGKMMGWKAACSGRRALEICHYSGLGWYLTDDRNTVPAQTMSSAANIHSNWGDICPRGELVIIS